MSHPRRPPDRKPTDRSRPCPCTPCSTGSTAPRTPPPPPSSSARRWAPHGTGRRDCPASGSSRNRGLMPGQGLMAGGVRAEVPVFARHPMHRSGVATITRTQDAPAELLRVAGYWASPPTVPDGLGVSSGAGRGAARSRIRAADLRTVRPGTRRSCTRTRQRPLPATSIRLPGRRGQRRLSYVSDSGRTVGSQSTRCRRSAAPFR